MENEKSQLVNENDDKVYSTLKNKKNSSSKLCLCHSFDLKPHVDSSAKKKLIYTSLICLIFMTIEAIGGYFANSLAIATDAAHLLTDFVGFMISLFSLFLSSKKATKEKTFGYYRAEVIGALMSILLIWVVTGALVFIAINRLIHNQHDVDARIMVITAAIGVFVNITMGLVLQCSGVPHGHSHGSDEEKQQQLHQNKETNINVKAAFIHILGDLLQNIGVLVASVIIYFRPDLAFIDPICTFTFAVIV
ncbi:Zinc transporter 2-like protein, partial [Leptotrombidium deliense]